jgi:hypothetical protein
VWKGSKQTASVFWPVRLPWQVRDTAKVLQSLNKYPVIKRPALVNLITRPATVLNV